MKLYSHLYLKDILYKTIKQLADITIFFSFLGLKDCLPSLSLTKGLVIYVEHL
jgi:hypothetical protein